MMAPEFGRDPRRRSNPNPPRLIHMDFAEIELRVIATLQEKIMTDTNSDYQSLSLKTKSGDLHPVPQPLLMKLLENASKAAEDLDAVKKTLFYGRDLPPHLQLIADNLPPLADQTDPQGVPTDALHSIIGVISEGGELADLAIKTLYQGEPFDAVNFTEELGDIAWYRAIGLAGVGQTIDQNDRQNIKKLQDKSTGRYRKGAFDSVDALNRDLDAERTNLELGSTPQPEYDAILSNVTMIDRGGVICLRGTIRDDTRGRFDDGKTIRTTRLHLLVRNDAGQLLAKTKNTTYLVESLDDAAAS